jgi:hypothetical protein
MTDEAGRSQGGDLLPLNRLDEEDALLPTEMLVVGLNTI